VEIKSFFIIQIIKELFKYHMKNLLYSYKEYSFEENDLCWVYSSFPPYQFVIIKFELSLVQIN